MNQIITIGREFGSGGRTIAKLAAQELGIPVYDNALLTQIAEESGFSEAYISEKAENATLGNLISRSLSGLGGYSAVTAEDFLWQSQRKIILELAEKESCIIVGRCADYILNGKADCLRVFIHASLEKRAERIVKVYGEREGVVPVKRLREKDKRRSNFYNYQTDMKWGDPHNYHLCLDSGKIGFEQCTAIICTLYKHRQATL